MMTKPFTSYPCLKGPKAGSLVDPLALTDTPLALLYISPLHQHTLCGGVCHQPSMVTCYFLPVTPGFRLLQGGSY